MWVFYALAGPIALGMVVATLQYFAASTVPLHVRWIVGYAWFCTISIIILVPADIWTVRKTTHHHHHYPLLRYPLSLCNFPFLLSPSLSAIPFSVVPISLQFPSLMPPYLSVEFPSLLPTSVFAIAFSAAPHLCLCLCALTPCCGDFFTLQIL